MNVQEFLDEDFDYSGADRQLQELNLDFDPAPEDAYLLHVLVPGVPEDEDDHEDLTEVLSVPQRLKRSQRMRRMSKRNAMLRKLRATRMAPQDRLKFRSRKAALMIIRQRTVGKAVENYDKLSLQQKMNIDQQIARRFGKRLHKVVDTLARRLMPRIRKHEMDRLGHARSAQVNEHLPHHRGHRSRKGKSDDLLHDPIRPHTRKEEGEYSEEELDAILGVDHLHLTDMGLNRKKEMRDVAEARKSSYDSEGSSEGDTHIINQLRKASMARGAHHEVTWSDGTKSTVHPQHAKLGLTKYAELMARSGTGHSGLDKQKFIIKLAKNPDAFYDMIGLKEDRKYVPNIKGKKDGVKVKPLPKGLVDTKAAGLDLPGKQYQYQSGYGPSLGNLTPNTFGESLATERARKRQARVPNPSPSIKVPGIKKPSRPPYKSQTATMRKASAAQNRAKAGKTYKPRSSAQKNTAYINRLNARTLRRGNVYENMAALAAAHSEIGKLEKNTGKNVKLQKKNTSSKENLAALLNRIRTHVPVFERLEPAAPNKLGIANNRLKLATEPRPNESLLDWKKRRAKLQQDVLKLGGKVDEALERKAEKSGFDYEVILEVYFRGLEEGDEQSAFERVNSFIAGGFAAEMDEDLMEAQRTVWVPSTTRRKGFYKTVVYDPADKIRTKNRRAQRKRQLRESGAGEVGTDELTARLASETPGQSINRDGRYMADLPWQGTKAKESADSGNSQKTYVEIKKALSGQRMNEVFDHDKAHDELTKAGWKHTATEKHPKKPLETHTYTGKGQRILHLRTSDYMGKKNVNDARLFHNDGGVTSATTLTGMKSMIR